jgi:hypothetical protein
MRNLIGAFFLLFFASAAGAQDFAAAERHFAAAQEAFAARHFSLSAVEFQSAYDITQDPVLLYNVGESWEKAGEGKKAVAAFTAYLAAMPDAQDKVDVKKRIKSIEQRHFKLVDQSAVGTPPRPPVEPPATPAPGSDVARPGPSNGVMAPTDSTAPPPTAPPPPPADTTTTLPPPPPPVAPAPPPKALQVGLVDESRPPSSLRIAAWVGVAATVAVLSAGAIFGLAAQSRADEISRRLNFVDSSGQPRTFDASASSDYSNLKSEGHLYNGLAIGFFSGAGALAITTAVLFAVDAKRPHEKTKTALRFAPMFGVGQGGLVFGGGF